MALTLFEDTYVLLATADSILTGDASWDAATDAEKEQALKDSTRVLDENLWLGYAKTQTQTLSFPRTAFTYFDPTYNLTIEVADSTVPRRLEYAVSRLALHYVKYPSARNQFSPEFDRIKLGPLELENSDASSNNTEPPRVPYIEVEAVIKPLLRAAGASPAGAWWRSN